MNNDRAGGTNESMLLEHLGVNLMPRAIKKHWRGDPGFIKYLAEEQTVPRANGAYE
jgi:hypothetical protein